MTDEKSLTPIMEKQVLFYDDEVTAVLVEENGRREIYVPLRPICNYLGVTWPSQRNRINRDPVLSKKVKGVFITNTPGGQQSMTCLPLNYLNGWLFGINASRVKEEIRSRLIRYQEECYEVLAEAFQDGRLTTDTRFEDLLQNTDNPSVQAYQMAMAIVRLARQQILLEGRIGDTELRLDNVEDRLTTVEEQLAGRGADTKVVTEAQASQISQAVKAVALALGKQTGRNEFGGIYGELYRKFGITSYKMLPASKFEDAMKFLSEWHQQITGDSPF